MKIYLDTNVFFDQWHLENPNFRYLFHFINNEWHELLVSELVVKEVQNKRDTELQSEIRRIEKGHNRAIQLNGKPFFSEILKFQCEDYDLKDKINNKALNVSYLDYSSIPHEEVVTRAMHQVRPFTAKEKGYRDTLIWLSLLDYLKENKITGTVAFVTSNVSDFFVKNDKDYLLHSDLLEDIKAKDIQCEIVPYVSLPSFVKENIDSDKHAIDHELVQDFFEEYVGDESEWFLGQVAYDGSSSPYFKELVLDEFCCNVESISFDVMEGTEDPCIEGTKLLADNDVYVRYSFNLRIVFVKIEISKAQYYAEKTKLNSLFTNIEIEKENVILETPIRPYFDVSFIYNIADQSLRDFEVDDVRVYR